MSSTKSFQSSLHQSPSLSQARYPGASTSSNYSNSQPFMSTLSLSSAQNASPVIPAFGHSIVMSSSMLSPKLTDVNQTSPFVSNSSSVITDGLSLAPSVSDMDFKTTFFYGSVSTPVPVLSVTRSLLSPINISKSYNQSSLVIEQTVTRQASSGFNGTTISSNETSPLPQSISFTNLGLRTTTLSSHVQQPRNTIVVSTQTNSSFNETTISSSQTSFGASVDFTSSFNLLSAAPTSPLPQSISSTIWTFRTTMFSSNVQQTGISQAVTRQTSYGINATTISSNESSLTTSTDVNLTLSLDVISVTPAMTVSRSINFSILTFRATALSSLVQSYASGAVYDGKSSVISATLLQNVSINDSRLAASSLTAVSSSLISSIGRTSFFATDPSPLQPNPMMSKRHTTFYSSYSLLSSYLLTETSSFAGLPGVESLSSLGTVTSSQSPPTFSVSGALSASETAQLSYLTSVFVSKSSEVQVSPSLPLSPLLSRDTLLLTSRTVMTARTTLTTTGTMYSSTGLAIDSSQVSLRSQASNVPSLPVLTLKASSGFVSSRSTSFIASLLKNLTRTFNAPKSVSLKASSSNLKFSSLTLFQERTLSSKSSFFKPPSTSFVLPTAKFTSTNISRTLSDPFSGVSSTALSLSSLASFQGSTRQPSLRRSSSSDLSISTSPAFDFGSTLNVTESRLHTEDSSGLFSSSQ